MKPYGIKLTHQSTHLAQPPAKKVHDRDTRPPNLVTTEAKQLIENLNSKKVPHKYLLQISISETFMFRKQRF
jgi:hypothetical protein